MPNRNLALDALRGLLAWVIVLVHVVWLAGLHESGSRAAIGLWAVYMFMMLAGYSAVATWREEPYTRYVAKKCFRLVPVLVVALILCWILRTTLVPAWFLTLSAQLYVVFPGIMWAIERYGRRVLSWLLLASLFFKLPLFYGIMERFAPMGELLPMNLFWFVIGICAHYLVDEYVLSDLSHKARRLDLLVWSGNLSYSLYLVHWPVITALLPLVPHSWPLPARILVLAALSVPASLLSSYLLYTYVELPGIKLGRLVVVRQPQDAYVA
jgi:peptidoglycan/LPS O-acetylase OafA/YrhL